MEKKIPSSNENTQGIPEGIADLEEYARSGKVPPLCKGYRVKINGLPYIFSKPEVTGREVLVAGNLMPPENYTLRVKIAGQAPRKVDLDEKVDLRHPGVEKFKALPRDQTEGEAKTLRYHFPLLPEDTSFLEEYGLPWEAINDGALWVLIHDFPLPDGYNHDKATVAIRMETGYPNSQLDMAYFFPPLARKSGVPIRATETIQLIDGKGFQRWSRHRTAQNPWKAGFDNLESHTILIEEWLCREFQK